MADVIDDLFVRLGLQTDKKQFDDAKGAFNSLRSTALQFGAAVGAGFGFREMTFGFSQMVEQAVRFGDAFSVAPEFVDQLGFAFESLGGTSQDAFSSIERVANLIEQTEWGEIPEGAFREAGVDPYLLEGVEGMAEAYERLSEAGRNMDPETARRFFSALGFSQQDLALFRGTGDESFGALMGDAENLAGLTQSMQDQGIAFNAGVTRLGRALDGVSRNISDLFVGDMAETMNSIADFLAENRDGITTFADNALPAIKSIAAGIGVLIGIQSTRAALGALNSIPGASALVAGAYIGLQGAEGMRDEQSQEAIDEAFEAGRALNNSMSMPSDEELRAIFSQGTSGASNSTTINVDARGSTDPQATGVAVENAVERALQRASENTVNDLRSDVR